jgi:hypothetical protein
MSEVLKARVLIAGSGILVSLGLFAACAGWLGGGPPSGYWAMLVLIPSVMLNSVWFILILAGRFLHLPDWLMCVLLPSSTVCWWWYLGGVAARRLRRWRA